MNPNEFKFICRDMLNEKAFHQCPIWVLWEDPEQEKEIKSWGIDTDKAWKEKIECKEEEYYYPYLGNSKINLVRGAYLYSKVILHSGLVVSGYLTGGFSFGIFSNEKEYLFNVNLSDLGQETAEKLSSSLGLEVEQVFPVTFKPVSKTTSGEIVYEKYW